MCPHVVYRPCNCSLNSWYLTNLINHLSEFTCDDLFIEHSNVTNATIIVHENLLAECRPGYKTDDLTQTFLIKCTVTLTWANVQNCSRKCRKCTQLCNPLNSRGTTFDNGHDAVKKLDLSQNLLLGQQPHPVSFRHYKHQIHFINKEFLFVM